MITIAPAAILFAVLALVPGAAQVPFDKYQRDRARQMVRDLAEAMRKHYYDPTYHGIDLDARLKAAEGEMQNVANLGQAFGTIAQTLDTLSDSHTFFVPPPRPARVEFGYVQRMIGDRCLVIAVRPNTDAGEKLAPGDQVVKWEGYAPNRDNVWKIGYALNQIYAVQTFHLRIRRLNGDEREVQVAAKVRQGKRVLDLIDSEGDIWQLLRESENDDRLARQRYAELGEALMVWKMPEFDLSEDEVNRLIARTRKHPYLVVDLRGNPGGLVKTLQYTVAASWTTKSRLPGGRAVKPI